MRKDNTNSNSLEQTEEIYNHPIQHKQCSKCKKWKPTSEFNKSSFVKCGYTSHCKECRKLYRLINSEKIKQNKKADYQKNKEHIIYKSSKYYNENKEKCSEKAKKYYQKNKEKIKERTRQHRLKYKDHYQKYNKNYRELHSEKYKEYKLQYYNDHKDEKAEYDKIYSQTERGKEVRINAIHRRRMLIESTPDEHHITLDQWKKIIESQNNKCAICGKPFTEDNPATRDHVHPLSKGGLHVSWNIQAVHKSCNSSKSNKINPENIQTWLHDIHENL